MVVQIRHSRRWPPQYDYRIRISIYHARVRNAVNAQLPVHLDRLSSAAMNERILHIALCRIPIKLHCSSH